ncbi:MAG: Zn-ribbon domain-containing OB-fold protein [Desulfobacterales bacterium]|nr:Zn-ribbon domain-containing OB-fold protein [Desulfobacterales bacterium]
MQKTVDSADAYVIDGKLALPYSYFAGRVGSTFITALRDSRQILGVRCEKCHKVFVPPRQTCEKCMADLRENWVTVENTGEVINFTVVRYSDRHLPREAPYILAMIKLDGADTPMVHILDEVKSEDVKAGMRVEAVYSENTTSTILDIDHFKPVS